MLNLSYIFIDVSCKFCFPLREVEIAREPFLKWMARHVQATGKQNLLGRSSDEMSTKPKHNIQDYLSTLISAHL